jgi:hypothetical protein
MEIEKVTLPNSRPLPVELEAQTGCCRLRGGLPGRPAAMAPDRNDGVRSAASVACMSSSDASRIVFINTRLYVSILSSVSRGLE